MAAVGERGRAVAGDQAYVAEMIEREVAPPAHVRHRFGRDQLAIAVDKVLLPLPRHVVAGAPLAQHLVGVEVAQAPAGEARIDRNADPLVVRGVDHPALVTARRSHYPAHHTHGVINIVRLTAAAVVELIADGVVRHARGAVAARVDRMTPAAAPPRVFSLRLPNESYLYVSVVPCTTLWIRRRASRKRSRCRVS
jgi:hypothetical protein